MIAAKAGEQLAPFLPQIVPRLYRYQFDPNLSIRQAMTSIWDALVTDKTLVRVCHTNRNSTYRWADTGVERNGGNLSVCMFLFFQVDKYLKEILQDVISNLTNNAWRVRESRYKQNGNNVSLIYTTVPLTYT